MGRRENKVEGEEGAGPGLILLPCERVGLSLEAGLREEVDLKEEEPENMKRRSLEGCGLRFPGSSAAAAAAMGGPRRDEGGASEAEVFLDWTEKLSISGSWRHGSG